MKRTKIVCTIGPASEKQETLEKMMRAGMNVCRLNMSHGTYEWHNKAIRAIRRATKKTKQPVAILLDLQGPKVRIGELGIKNYELGVGNEVIFTTGLVSGNKIPIAHKNFHKFVKKGSHLLIADGIIECVVERVSGKDIFAKVTLPGKLISRKGIAVQGVSLPLPCLTAKDKKDARWARNQDIDFVALSFVKKADDVKVLRKLFGGATLSVKRENTQCCVSRCCAGSDGKTLSVKRENTQCCVSRCCASKCRAPQIIVKIETREAVKNFDSILQEADGIMIARGDLALAVGAEEVPIIQKTLIEKCRRVAKPVIVATEMLGSMENNPRPTRAEASDVANAVIDHTDAVMLSGESATGNFPVEAVRTMARIIKRTERSHFDDVAVINNIYSAESPEQKIIFDASILARSDKAKAIVAGSLTGSTGRLLSRYRTEIPIYVGSPDLRVARQLNLSWGIYPFYLPRVKTNQDLLEKLSEYLKKTVQTRGNVVLVSSEKIITGGQNMVEMRKI